MRTALFLVSGALVGGAVWAALRPVFEHPALQRENFRGRPVATAAGVVIPVTVLLVEAARAVASVAGVGESITAERAQLMVLLAALGFGLLGLVDDLVGGGAARGFGGHLAAAARGRLTTGALKLLGGGAVAVTVVAPFEGDRFARLVVDAALVALCANLANLLDRAPARTTKAAALAFAGVLVAAGDHVGLGSVAVAVGAAMALLLDELRERVMLGDVGANVVGGVLGLGIVMVTAPTTRALVLLGVAALNLASEVVSFSEVISRVRVLRAIDQFGRRRG